MMGNEAGSPPDCHVAWDLYNESTVIYRTTSTCDGTAQLSFLLITGIYQLTGEATIGATERAQVVLPLQVG
jgi:hypothetical protein